MSELDKCSTSKDILTTGLASEVKLYLYKIKEDSGTMELSIPLALDADSKSNELLQFQY